MKTSQTFLRLASLALLLVSMTKAPAQTAADVTGPDGIVYPDWRYAGVPGGIPTNLVVRTSITAQPAYPGDIALALEQAAALASAAGGGVVTIPAGTYDLHRPVLITQSNVVLRGAGKTLTKFIFRYQPQNVSFYKPVDGASVTKNGWIEIHANPVNLTAITLSSGGVQIAKVPTQNGMFSLTSSGTACIKKVGAGMKILSAIADYSDGTQVLNHIVVNLINGTDPNPYHVPLQLGAINFYGPGEIAPQHLLTVDGVRGDTTLTVAAGHGFTVGDTIQLIAPATPAWNASIQNACPSQDFRQYLYEVTAVSGNLITINQPLRIDYPVADGSFTEKFIPIKGCGVEDFTLEQDFNIRTNGITFSKASGCWAKGMAVNKTGRNPLYFLAAKWCEMRDCTFDDQWTSVSYVGWERAYDCLMENITTRSIRHAPLVQWSAAGNVIRNSAFYDSDAHWHAGWSNENLFEQCLIESNFGGGSYGYGMYSTPPYDASHGPNGPRNVVYNNDVTSPLSAVWLGGQNRGWIFRYNRFASDSGRGIFAQMSSSDHIIRNNVFAMRNGINGIWLEDNTCTGIQLIDNQFAGTASVAEIVGGAAGVATAQGNTASDYLTPLTFTNGGFESALTGWNTGTSNGMMQASSAAAYQGSAGLRITDASATQGGTMSSQTIPVQPGKGYMVRFWARTLSGTDAKSVMVYLYYFDAASKKISSLPSAVPLYSFWSKNGVEQVAPPNAAKAQVVIASSTTAAVTMDLDAFEFGQVPYEIANNSFESGTLALWSNAGDNGMSAVVRGAAKSGAFGLRVTDNSTTNRSNLSSTALPVTVGNTCQVRFWAKIGSGTGLSVDFQFFNSVGTNVGTASRLVPTLNDEWRQYVLRAVVPAGATTVSVNVRSSTADQVTADLDDFTYSEVAPRPIATVPSIYLWQRNGSSPAAPAGMTTTGSYKKIHLNWAPVSGATSYTIKRSANAVGPFTTLIAGHPTTSHTDFIGLMGATYYYTVSAVNGSGESGNSNVAGATTVP